MPITIVSENWAVSSGFRRQLRNQTLGIIITASLAPVAARLSLYCSPQ